MIFFSQSTKSPEMPSLFLYAQLHVGACQTKPKGQVSASLPKHPQHSTNEHAHVHTRMHVGTFAVRKKQLAVEYAKHSTYQQFFQNPALRIQFRCYFQKQLQV